MAYCAQVMCRLSILYCVFLFGVILIHAEQEQEHQQNFEGKPTFEDLGDEPPTVLVALLVRNKAHVLPMFLTYFERLNYPKQRMALWIRSDHNSDNSIELLELWLNHTQLAYHSVDFSFENSTQKHQNESSAHDWPVTRFRHLIRLKEAALAYAQRIWADYIFFLDADVLLTDSEALTYLTGLRLPIVSPMLLSEGLYSNFWCGMTPEYYYLRTEEYKEIYDREKRGVFSVPMIHTAVLIRMNYVGTRFLTFERERLIEQQQNDKDWVMEVHGNQQPQCRAYDGPVDDIIVFAISANCTQIPLFISNERAFGYILQPLDAVDSIDQDMQQLVNTRINIINDWDLVEPVNEYFESYTTKAKKTNLTLDRIFMINLARRPERREKMERIFDELGLDVKYFEAVDGKNLNESILDDMGIKMLSIYEDPYHHRQMTMGEIGCFLSHYRIWELMVENELNEVLILEDDIRFEPYFNDRAQRVLKQARDAVEYDLIYLGRKRLKENSEPWVLGTDTLVHVGYSYWTLGYIISLKGARKLLAANPLEKLVPVDEFLPIMFDKHPNETLKAAFPERNLIAFSSAPLLLYPTHYTGDEGYISDTEDSELMNLKDGNSNGLNGPQPKSNRELEFPMADEPQQQQQQIQENFFNDGVTAKQHDEF